MPHEIDKEALTAYMDGRLPDKERAAVSAHLAGCPECAAYLERVKTSAAAFRKHGTEKVPARVLSAALDRSAKKGGRFVWVPLHPSLQPLVYVVVLVGVVSFSGACLKRFMPQLFSLIQGMISAASGTMGKGGQ